MKPQWKQIASFKLYCFYTLMKTAPLFYSRIPKITCSFRDTVDYLEVNLKDKPLSLYHFEIDINNLLSVTLVIKKHAKKILLC